MENRKWLKRKYPKSFSKANKFLNDSELEAFKSKNYKLGILKRDICQVQKYPKGQLIMFKRSNPVNDYNYPIHNAVIKCDVGFTSSGYHSINIFDGDFKEVKV